MVYRVIETINEKDLQKGRCFTQREGENGDLHRFGKRKKGGIENRLNKQQ